MNPQNNETIVVEQHTKAGRPTKHSPETVERLLGGLADGLPIKSACITAGIGVSTLADWRERYPELEVRMEEAREKARQKMLQRIKRASENDWRAAAEWLRLTFPQDYRRASTPTTATTNITNQTLVISPEQQERLRQQRKRILKSEQRSLQPVRQLHINAENPAGSAGGNMPVREAEVVKPEQPSDQAATACPPGLWGITSTPVAGVPDDNYADEPFDVTNEDGGSIRRLR